MLKIVVCLLLILLLVPETSSQCSADVVMPNIIKDSVMLKNQFQGQEAASSFPYFSRMFSSKPKIAYSISSIDIKSNGNALSYYLDIIQQTFLISIYFNAINQQWNTVRVNILLTSHSNIIVDVSTVENIGLGQTVTKSIPLMQFTSAQLGISPTHLVFIVGLDATITGGNFTVEASSQSVNPSLATLAIKTGSTTSLSNITVTSIIYDSQSSQFLSYAGVVTYNTFNKEYLNLYNNFVPIYNYLIGLSAMQFGGTNNELYYGYHMDFLNSSTVLNLSAIPVSVQYAKIAFSYFTLGMPTNHICAKCGNNFISGSSCIDICPVLTYQHTFSDGGKACLQCPLLAGLKINDLADGCNCLPGYQVLTQNQCIPITNKTSCSGTNVVQNGTQCVCAPGTHNISGKCQVCPSGTFFDGSICKQSQITCTQANSILNPAGTACICSDGFSNYSGVCRPTCKANSTWDASSLSCRCLPNFMDIAGICQQCKSDQSYDPNTKSCTCTLSNTILNTTTGVCDCSQGFIKFANRCIPCPPNTIALNGQCTPTSCQVNQILINGKCQCDKYSYKQGSVCIACNLGTFPNNVTKTCQNCMNNCDNCTDAVTCDICANTFIYDFTTKSCIKGGSGVTVTTRTGFPVYTHYAIVTDFDINAGATMAIKSRKQLDAMVTIDFGGQPPPQRVLFSQNPNNLNGVRVVLDYRGLLPLSQFGLNYTFTQQSLGLKYSTVVSYNALSNKKISIIPN